MTKVLALQVLETVAGSRGVATGRWLMIFDSPSSGSARQASWQAGGSSLTSNTSFQCSVSSFQRRLPAAQAAELCRRKVDADGRARCRSKGF